MNARLDWSTASDGGEAHTQPAELQALGDHLGHCRAQGRRLFALQCGGEAMHRFVASRLMTTLLAVSLLIGIAVLLW